MGRRLNVLGAIWTSGIAAFALSASVVMAPVGAAEESSDVPTKSDRVLQSVDVSVGTGSNITSVVDTHVSFSVDDGAEVATETAEHTPADVVEQLPVRILTSYRTDEGTGTDLADLEGYSGKVTIELSVQNLTLQPEDVSFDSGGRHYSRVELVGTPLTVVAGANLGIPVSQIVTNADKAGASQTNGVLSQDQEGHANVQWATILAPPQLPASTVFTVVATVEDFSVPTFNVTVQPGYISDPSVAQIVSTAFGSRGSSEADLIQDTILVMGDLDELLGETGAVVTEARETLEYSGQTIGTKTVSDLHSSLASVTASTNSTISTLESLNMRAALALQSSNSAALAQVNTAALEMSRLLGNTSMKAPAFEVTGEGCGALVENSDSAHTVYGSILTISALLDAYTEASAQCQRQIHSTLTEALGPKEPNAENCEGNDSVSCQLSSAKSEFDEALERLADDASAAVNVLQGNLISFEPIDEINESLKDLAESIESLESDSSRANIRTELDEARKILQTVGSIGDDYVQRLEKLHDHASNSLDKNGEAEATRTELRQAICELGETPLPTTKVNELLAYISTTDCFGNDLAASPGSISLETHISDNHIAWQTVRDLTAPDENGDYQIVLDYKESLDALEDSLDALDGALDGGNLAIDDAVEDLRSSYKSLQDRTDELARQVTEINANQGEVQEEVLRLFRNTEQGMQTNLDGIIDRSLVSISDTTTDSLEAANDMFARLILEMSLSSAAITDSGGALIGATQADLVQLADVMSHDMQREMETGIASINSSVSGAVVDLKIAALLLSEDIQLVLADIGVNTPDGGGLLGVVASSTASTALADSQIAAASEMTVEYANLQRGKLADDRMRSAQTRAASARYMSATAFARPTRPNTEYTTVYSFTIGADE